MQNSTSTSEVNHLQEIKEAIVEKHNKLRAKVANGKETRGVDGAEPPASDMRVLEWNEDLAEVAQRYFENSHEQLNLL